MTAPTAMPGGPMSCVEADDERTRRGHRETRRGGVEDPRPLVDAEPRLQHEGDGRAGGHREDEETDELAG